MGSIEFYKLNFAFEWENRGGHSPPLNLKNDGERAENTLLFLFPVRKKLEKNGFRRRKMVMEGFLFDSVFCSGK